MSPILNFLVCLSFCGILVNMKKIVEGDHSKLADGLIIKLASLQAQAHFHQETKSSGMSASAGSCLVVGGSAFLNPSSICWRCGMSLSEPTILVQL